MRYDVFNDNMSEDEYIDWTISLFNGFDKILRKNGCVLYNISYSSTRRDMLFLTIAEIVKRTNFSIADMIIWKKKTALPNNTSPNKLTRIVEPVFVFARRDDMETFICNKKVTSIRERTGQKMYENVYNFVEAANNDGMCKLNRATYSSELCEKLLKLYGKSGMTVYDPFMGTGTTAVACKRLSMNYIGSELSQGQTDFANERIEKDSGIPGDYEVILENDRDDTQSENNCETESKPKKRGRKKKVDNVQAEPLKYIQMELFDENGNPLFENNPKKETEKTEPSIDDSEFSEEKINYDELKDITRLDNTLHENENNEENEENKENEDSIKETVSKNDVEEEIEDFKKEDGYIINGYFHSYSTCPVGEDEFE